MNTPEVVLPRLPEHYHKAVASSPLFNKIPGELRERIYSFILPQSIVIAIEYDWSEAVVLRRNDNGINFEDDDFVMKICNGVEHAYLGYEPRDDDPLVETSIFQAAQALHIEGLHFLLSRNTIFMMATEAFSRFSKLFPQNLSSIKSLSLVPSIHDQRLEKEQYLELRAMVKSFPNLKSLTLCCQLIASYPKGFTLFHPAVLNYFRPLARLPLERCKVQISVRKWYYGDQQDAAEQQRQCPQLERMAEGLLMRDVSEPEEPQVVRPTDQNEALRAEEEEIRRAGAVRMTRLLRML